MTGFKATSRILIVEDDKNIAALLQKYLIRDGFQAELAHDGLSALKSVQRSAPALVILVAAQGSLPAHSPGGGLATPDPSRCSQVSPCTGGDPIA